VTDMREGSHIPGAGGRGARTRAAVAEKQGRYALEASDGDVWKAIAKLEQMMFQAAKDLEFEQAARLRDQIESLRKRAVAY
jgi:excinuclease ABC subunit B